MDRVEEIEIAIDRLPPEDYKRVIAWLREHEQSRWDEKWIGIRLKADLTSCSSKRKPNLLRNSFVSGRRERESVASRRFGNCLDHYRSLGRLAGETNVTLIWR
jgi:hypothetical protein